MVSRWNSQILPRAETATSHAFAFSEIDRFGSFIKLPSSDSITENPQKNRFSCEIIDDKYSGRIKEQIKQHNINILLIKGLKCGVPNSAQIRIPRAAS